MAWTGSYAGTCLFKHSFRYTPPAGQELQDPLLQKLWAMAAVYGEFPELLRDVMSPTMKESNKERAVLLC